MLSPVGIETCKYYSNFFPPWRFSNDFICSVSTCYVGVACISILLYDHFLTFDDEVNIYPPFIERLFIFFDAQVEFVWMRRKGISTF